MSGDLLFPPEGTDPRGARTRELVTGLLDRGYEEAAGAVVRGVARGMTSGIVAQRLDELEAEAARLAEAGERLTPDNPVLRALLADMEAELDAGADALNAAAGAVQEAGAEASTTLTRELAVGGMDPNVLAQIGVRWNVPDPEAVARAVGFVTSDAWAAEVARFPGLALETVRNQAIMGIADGWGPRRTARAIRQSVEGFPAHQANNLMRTLQLQSYRAGAAVNQQANETILSGVIRIATLDDRVCMACLALHGTRYPVGTVIQDHHQGRCVGIPEVRGVPRTVQTGPDWFDGLPEDRQIAIAGPGAAAALKAGEVRLQDFVEPYTDPVFGEMLRQGSLRRARGGAASGDAASSLPGTEGLFGDRSTALQNVPRGTVITLTTSRETTRFTSTGSVTSLGGGVTPTFRSDHPLDNRSSRGRRSPPVTLVQIHGRARISGSLGFDPRVSISRPSDGQ